MNLYTYLSILALILMSILVIYSRIYIGCHNTLQVLVGSVIGLIYGIILYRTVEIFAPNKTDKVSNSLLLQIGGGLIIIMLVIYNILL